MNMSSLYRLRPYNEHTISELRDPYLWFSKPSAYKDTEDSNVRLMIDDNEILHNALTLILNDHGIEELEKLMAHIGICCFTKDIPRAQDRFAFPNGKKSICIEYDREKIANYFLNVLGMPDCFKEVVYSNTPIKVETDGNYHILMRKDEDGDLYESILQMKYDPKHFMDKLLFFLLTRINERYSRQKECRIIWAGFRIKESEDKGYHINIPNNCIKYIYIYPDTPNDFKESIMSLGYEVKTIE